MIKVIQYVLSIVILLVILATGLGVCFSIGSLITPHFIPWIILESFVIKTFGGFATILCMLIFLIIGYGFFALIYTLKINLSSKRNPLPSGGG